MFNFFKKQKQPENLKEVLEYLKELEKKIEGVSKRLEKLEKKNKFSLQKIEILRYNPFSEIGGNQSFSVVLLDGNNDGAIITSIYSRDGNRVYAKPIKNGVSEYSLSEEEKEVLSRALRTETN